MSYIVLNSNVFTAAFSGACAGMGVSGRIISQSDPTKYAGLVAIATAFAEEFDTLWGATIVGFLEVQSIQSSVEALWADRAPIVNDVNLNPTTWESECRAIIALVQEALTAYVNGTFPNPSLGGAVTFSGGTSSAALASIIFGNANGISFGLNGSTMTASVGAGGAAGSISAGTTNFGLGQAVFSNSNGISFGMNAGTVTASHNGLTSQSTAPAAISAGTTLATNGTVAFSNSNGVSFGMNGRTVTASHNGLTSQSTAPGAISAGTTIATSGTIIFSNSNGVSFGLNGQTVTASVNAGGNAITADFYDNLDFAFYGVNNGASASGNAYLAQPIGSANGVVWVERLHAERLFPFNITASTAQVDLSLSGANLSLAFSSTLMFGVYTSSGQTLSLANSFSVSFGATINANNTVSFQGQRFLTVHSSLWSSSPVFLSQSQYFHASIWLTSGTTAGVNNVFGAQKQPFGIQRSGTLGASSANSQTLGFNLFYGSLSVSSSVLPSSIANSDLSKTAVNGAVYFIPHFQMIANTALSAF